MNPMAKLMVTGGIVLIASGLLWQFGGRFLQLDRLPGDIVVERENFPREGGGASFGGRPKPVNQSPEPGRTTKRIVHVLLKNRAAWDAKLRGFSS